MIKRNTILITLILLMLVGSGINAQQINMLNTAIQNKYALNPALAGDKGDTWFHMNYRNQWQDMPGSPNYFLLSADGMLNNKKVGLGFQFYNDETDVLAQSGFYGTYAYKLKINEVHKLSLGLSAGLVQNRLLLNRIMVEDNTDPNIYGSDKVTRFNANLGANYKYKGFAFNLASFQLFQNEYDFSQNSGYEIEYRHTRHYIAGLSYNFMPLKEQPLEIEPFAIARNPQGMPAVFDAGSSFWWNEMFWLDCFYRTNNTLAFTAGVLYNKQLSVGFSYEMNNSAMATYGGNSSEIVVGFRPGKVLKDKPQKNTEPIVGSKQEKAKEKSKTSKTSASKDELQSLKSKHEAEKALYEDVCKRYKIEIADIGKEDKAGSPPSNEYAMIIGGYKNINDAKAFQKVIERESGLETSLLATPKENFYLIYTKKIGDQQEAKKAAKELKKFKSNFFSSQAWIYDKNKR